MCFAPICCFKVVRLYQLLRLHLNDESRKYCLGYWVTCDTAWWLWVPKHSAWHSIVRHLTCTWSRHCPPHNKAYRPTWLRHSCCACCSWLAQSSTCSFSDRIFQRLTGSWSSQSLPKRTDNCLDGNHKTYRYIDK